MPWSPNGTHSDTLSRCYLHVEPNNVRVNSIVLSSDSRATTTYHSLPPSAYTLSEIHAAKTLWRLAVRTPYVGKSRHAEAAYRENVVGKENPPSTTPTDGYHIARLQTLCRLFTLLGCLDKLMHDPRTKMYGRWSFRKPDPVRVSAISASQLQVPDEKNTHSDQATNCPELSLLCDVTSKIRIE